MKIIAVFRKTLIEQIRDYWVLIMTLISAPFFVFIYWMMFAGGSTSYNVALVNLDPGGEYAKILVEEVKKVTYENGDPILNVRMVNSQTEGETLIKNRGVAGLMVIPEDFSERFSRFSKIDSVKAFITLVGDIANPQYSVAVIMMNSGLESFVRKLAPVSYPVEIKETLLGKEMLKSEFETYIPGLVIFSVIMLMFPIAMTLVREKETQTIKRLKLSSVTTFEYLTGVSLALVIVGIASIACTILTAMLFGFTIEGSIIATFIILGLFTLSIIGISLMVVSFSKTSTFVLSAGTFPLFILMFFTGAVFPVPRGEWFEITGHIMAWNDLLPPTQATIALNKVVNLGASFSDVGFEMMALLLLSLLYFAVGVWLFKKVDFRK